MFTQSFIQAYIKENIKAPRHWPLWGEFTGDRWIPRTKGQLRGKCFHLMTSSWCRRVSNRLPICLLDSLFWLSVISRKTAKLNISGPLWGNLLTSGLNSQGGKFEPNHVSQRFSLVHTGSHGRGSNYDAPSDLVTTARQRSWLWVCWHFWNMMVPLAVDSGIRYLPWPPG